MLLEAGRWYPVSGIRAGQGRAPRKAEFPPPAGSTATKWEISNAEGKRVPTGPPHKSQDSTADLTELFREFKQARDKFAHAQARRRLGKLQKAASEKWEAVLKKYYGSYDRKTRSLKPGASSELPFDLPSRSRSQYVPEWRQIESIVEKRDRAWARLQEIWTRMRQPLDRYRSPETSEKFKVLDRISPWPGLAEVDRVISLVESILAAPSAAEASTPTHPGSPSEMRPLVPQGTGQLARKRGRPTTIPDELKRAALQVQGGKARAQILYQIRYPTPQQVKNVPSILRYFQKTHSSSKAE